MDKNEQPLRLREHKAGMPVPRPRELSAEEVAQIVEQFKAQFDPVACEAEFAELLRQHESGRLESADALLAELEAEAGEQERKESA